MKAQKLGLFLGMNMAVACMVMQGCKAVKPGQGAQSPAYVAPVVETDPAPAPAPPPPRPPHRRTQRMPETYVPGRALRKGQGAILCLLSWWSVSRSAGLQCKLGASLV